MEARQPVAVVVARNNGPVVNSTGLLNAAARMRSTNNTDTDGRLGHYILQGDDEKTMRILASSHVVMMRLLGAILLYVLL